MNQRMTNNPQTQALPTNITFLDSRWFAELLSAAWRRHLTKAGFHGEGS
jgi:hypothetical protein